MKLNREELASTGGRPPASLVFNRRAGVVLRPIPRLVMTLDGYYIKINDRIVSSENPRPRK